MKNSSCFRIDRRSVEVTLHALSVSIQQTVRDFSSESSRWESEVLALFHDVDRFLTTERPSGGELASTAVAEDIVGLKGLVEQQTEVLAALVHALTGQAGAPEIDHPCERTERLVPEVDPFERLQQAVAAASEAS